METADQSLREKDGGRTQRGILIVAGCALIWALALWVGIRLI